MQLGIDKTLHMFDEIEKAAIVCVDLARSGLTGGSAFRAISMVQLIFAMIKDAHYIVPELADLDSDEARRLAERAFELFKNVVLSIK